MHVSPALEQSRSASPGDARLGVASEVGRLRRVILHRPGLELRRLTPSNKDALLFDDVLWVERACQEHDAFARVLSDRGVEVLLLGDLLAGVLELPDVRSSVVARTIRDIDAGPRFGREIASWLTSLDGADLATRLIGGVAFDDLPFGSGSLAAATVGEDFLLAPLPNQLFTRDASCWIYDGVSVNAMARPARRREALHLDAVYRNHPVFDGMQVRRWDDELIGPAHLEGGDVLVIGRGLVVAGLGERTRAGALEELAERLFVSGQVTEMIVVELPRHRSTIHLDSVLTMVDDDAFLYYPSVADAPAYRLTPAGDGVRVERAESVFGAIAAALGGPELRLIPTGGDRFESQREQWDDGNNVLALAPGLVVAYERNADSNARLRRAGIEVLTLAGGELGRGHGGPRCMSCPIYRDPVPERTARL